MPNAITAPMEVTAVIAIEKGERRLLADSP